MKKNNKRLDLVDRRVVLRALKTIRAHHDKKMRENKRLGHGINAGICATAAAAIDEAIDAVKVAPRVDAVRRKRDV